MAKRRGWTRRPAIAGDFAIETPVAIKCPPSTKRYIDKVSAAAKGLESEQGKYVNVQSDREPSLINAVLKGASECDNVGGFSVRQHMLASVDIREHEARLLSLVYNTDPEPGYNFLNHLILDVADPSNGMKFL